MVQYTQTLVLYLFIKLIIDYCVINNQLRENISENGTNSDYQICHLLELKLTLSQPELGTSSTSSRLKISQGLHSKFLFLAWAFSTEPCSWLEIYKTNLPLSLSYTNLANSLIFLLKLQFFPNIINKTMLMSAVFFEEL